MTATADIVTDGTGATCCSCPTPRCAFDPDGGAGAARQGGIAGALMPRPRPGRPAERAARRSAAAAARRVYVLGADGKPQPVAGHHRRHRRHRDRGHRRRAEAGHEGDHRPARRRGAASGVGGAAAAAERRAAAQWQAAEASGECRRSSAARRHQDLRRGRGGVPGAEGHRPRHRGAAISSR